MPWPSSDITHLSGSTMPEWMAAFSRALNERRTEIGLNSVDITYTDDGRKKNYPEASDFKGVALRGKGMADWFGEMINGLRDIAIASESAPESGRYFVIVNLSDGKWYRMTEAWFISAFMFSSLDSFYSNAWVSLKDAFGSFIIVAYPISIKTALYSPMPVGNNFSGLFGNLFSFRAIGDYSDGSVVYQDFLFPPPASGQDINAFSEPYDYGVTICSSDNYIFGIWIENKSRIGPWGYYWYSAKQFNYNIGASTPIGSLISVNIFRGIEGTRLFKDGGITFMGERIPLDDKESTNVIIYSGNAIPPLNVTEIPYFDSRYALDRVYNSMQFDTNSFSVTFDEASKIIALPSFSDR